MRVDFHFHEQDLLIFDKQKIVSTIGTSGTERLEVGLWWLLVGPAYDLCKRIVYLLDIDAGTLLHSTQAVFEFS